MSVERAYKIGEYIFAAGDLVDTTGKQYMVDGESARIMVYDPAKGDTPYGLRKDSDNMIGVWAGETQLRKDPSRAHLTPKI